MLHRLKLTAFIGPACWRAIMERRLKLPPTRLLYGGCHIPYDNLTAYVGFFEKTKVPSFSIVCKICDINRSYTHLKHFIPLGRKGRCKKAEKPLRGCYLKRNVPTALPIRRRIGIARPTGVDEYPPYIHKGQIMWLRLKLRCATRSTMSPKRQP